MTAMHLSVGPSKCPKAYRESVSKKPTTGKFLKNLLEKPCKLPPIPCAMKFPKTPTVHKKQRNTISVSNVVINLDSDDEITGDETMSLDQKKQHSKQLSSSSDKEIEKTKLPKSYQPENSALCLDTNNIIIEVEMRSQIPKNVPLTNEAGEPGLSLFQEKEDSTVNIEV